MIELLAALSASAAVGIRISLPLLAIGLLQGQNLWSSFPLLSSIPSQLLLVILISGSLIELICSKKLLGQRILQLISLVLSPLVGAIMALALSGGLFHVVEAKVVPSWLIGLIGGIFAFVLQLIQAAWFYRWQGLPLWAVLVQDVLCLVLVFLADIAPHMGGLMALIVLLLAIRSLKHLHSW